MILGGYILIANSIHLIQWKCTLQCLAQRIRVNFRWGVRQSFIILFGGEFRTGAWSFLGSPAPFNAPFPGPSSSSHSHSMSRTRAQNRGGGCDSKEPVCLNSKWKLTVFFSLLCYFWLIGKEGWKVKGGGYPLGFLNIIWPWLIGEARKPSNTLSAQIMGRADRKRSIFSGNWDWVPRSLLSACFGLALGPPHWLSVFPLGTFQVQET